MHFRFEVDELCRQFLSTRDGVIRTIRTRLEANRDMLRQLRDICDELESIGTRLRWVWVDMRHFITFHIWLEKVWRHLLAFGANRDELRRIELNSRHVERRYGDLMAIGENTGHEYSQMGRLLWVRHICYEFRAFRDISWWLHDELRHLSWFMTSGDEFETFEAFETKLHSI